MLNGCVEMKKFLLVGLSPYPNTHSKEMRQVFNISEWQAEDIATSHPDLNNEIIRVANTYRPDLTWIQIQSPGISQEAIQALKVNGSFIIQWSGDKRNILPECYFNYAQWGVDLSTFSNMEDVEIMRKCGYESEFLQIGYSEEIYHPDESIPKDIDVIFMGNTFGHFPLSGLRREMVRELKHVYGDRFKAFGSGMPDGNLSSDQFAEAAMYRRAKIGINLSHFDTHRYTSDRLFRMIGCGVCVLSKRYPGIEQDFEQCEHLDIWDDINSLKNLINYYLNSKSINIENWKHICNEGHDLAVNKFTFKHMAENILELYNKYKPS